MIIAIRQRTIFCLFLSLLLILSGCQPWTKEDKAQDHVAQSTTSVLTDTSLSQDPHVLNVPAYLQQIALLKKTSPLLYQQQRQNYQAIHRWLLNGAGQEKLHLYHIKTKQVSGRDHGDNVLFTGYYTPVLAVRHTRGGEFQYPLYALPAGYTAASLPSRAEIYRGVLGNKEVLAYASSLLELFIMQVQGSGFVDFEDGTPAVYYAFAGKNSYPYTGIGQILVSRGEINPAKLSMQAIRTWASQHSLADLRVLLEKNASYVFFRPVPHGQVKGAVGVPLIANTAVAVDKKVIPLGSVMLAEVPVLTKKGTFSGHYQQRLLVALDVGSAIKGQHIDLYTGMGEQAEVDAGHYNHLGRVWLLQRSK